MPRLTSVLILVALAWPVVHGAAVAQSSPAPTAAELEEAQRQFTLGVAEYEAGRLEDALVRFSRAHALSHAPELLYNVATVHERLRHDAEALAAYEAYLAVVPESAELDAIEARVRVLREELDASPVAAPVAPPPAPVAPPSAAGLVDAGVRSGSDPAPWALTAAGGVLAAGGAVLVGVAALDASTVETASTWRDARPAFDRAPIFDAVGWAAIGVGAALMIAGVAWGASSSGSGPSATVAVGPGSIHLAGSF